MLIHQIQNLFNYHVDNPVVLVLLAFLLGALSTIITVKTEENTINMRRSMIVLPPLVCSAILAINGSVGTSIAVAGVFSLVRFQSAERSSKDLTQAFFAMSIGLLCSTGGVFTAVVLTFILSLILVIAKKLIPDHKETYDFSVVVYETYDYEESLNNVLIKYFKMAKPTKIKPVGANNLVELHYRVVIKDDINARTILNEVQNEEFILKASCYKELPEN